MTSQKNKVSPVRQIACTLLERIIRDDAFAERVLATTLDKHHLPKNQKAQITDLVYGTLRYQPQLDALLNSLLQKPIHKLPPLSQAVLRCALYQLQYFHSKSDYGVVNDSVELVKKLGKRHQGIVNAILRRFLRESEIIIKDFTNKPAREQLSFTYATPDWIIKELETVVPESSCQSLLTDLITPAPIHIRVNIKKITVSKLRDLFMEQQLEFIEHQYPLPDLLIVKPASGSVESFPGYKEGFFTVQDGAAQLAATLIKHLPATSFLDLCAAPGGKTANIATQLTSLQSVVANDYLPIKLKRIEKLFQRLHITKPSLISAPAQSLKQLQKQFSLNNLPDKYDLVLVDAPCSGLGTIRRRPEIKSRASMEKVNELACLQKEILNTAASLVRTNGTLLYCVCTFIKQEGANQIQQFLKQHKQFNLADPPHHKDLQMFRVSQGIYTTISASGLDKFFYAYLEKNNV